MTYDTSFFLWQGFFALSIFASTFLCYLFPIFWYNKRNRRLNEIDDGIEEAIGSYWPQTSTETRLTEQKRVELKRLLSYCNCLSAGVFLGVCFLNLIPIVEKEFDQLLKDFEGLKNFVGTFPLGLFSVVAGLFLVLILEALLSNCFNGHAHSQPSNEHVLYLDEPFSESSHDGHEHEELLLPDPELQPNQQSRPKVNGHNHNGGGNDDHHHHHRQSNQQHASSNHGHLHCDPQMFFSNQSNSMLTFFILMFATSIHSLFEGLALGLQTSIANGLHLFIGIILHECLVALALGLNAVRLQQQNVQLRMHFKFAIVFAATIPVGSVLGILLGYTPGHFGRFVSAIFQGFAAGTFVHVTFLELIPSELLSSGMENSHGEHSETSNTHSVSGPLDDHSATTTTLPASSSTNDNNTQISHTSSGSNVKLKKILLLLLGFLIMSIFPFFSSD